MRGETPGKQNKGDDNESNQCPDQEAQHQSEPIFLSSEILYQPDNARRKRQ